MTYVVRRCWLMVCLSGVLLVSVATPAENLWQFDNPQQEQTFQQLVTELRCPKCQNASLADSDAPVAQDIKQRIADLIKAHKTKREIKDYLIDRYGDFISYQPPFNQQTLVLWLLPIALLLMAVIWWLRHQQKQHQDTVQALSAVETKRLDELLKGSGDQKNDD